jgi:hypothetical protein
LAFDVNLWYREVTEKLFTIDLSGGGEVGLGTEAWEELSQAFGFNEVKLLIHHQHVWQNEVE